MGGNVVMEVSVNGLLKILNLGMVSERDDVSIFYIDVQLVLLG